MVTCREQGPLRVGLTGGIASGKSTVAGLFGELGAPVVDADALARELVEPGGELLGRLAHQFGSGILDEEGRLDRAALGRIVFADSSARKRLEAITHPAIIDAAERRVEALGRQGHRVVLYEAALLVETGRHREMDLLVVVTAEEGQRVERLMRRDGLDRQDALERLAAQMPQQAKVEAADYVIDNSGTLAQTRAQVLEVWKQILSRLPQEEE
jgi:dephospho-CoA kinase